MRKKEEQAALCLRREREVVNLTLIAPHFTTFPLPKRENIIRRLLPLVFTLASVVVLRSSCSHRGSEPRMLGYNSVGGARAGGLRAGRVLNLIARAVYVRARLPKHANTLVCTLVNNFARQVSMNYNGW